MRLKACCLIFSFLFLENAFAADCRSQIELGLWSESHYKIGGGDLATTGCPSAYTQYRVGLSYFLDDQNAYKGVTASIRLKANTVIAPFIGVGGLVGFGESTTDAGDDGVDNNQNGIVDEFNEISEDISGHAFIYPEAGLTLLFSPSFGLTIAARQYYGDTFQGDVIYSLGLVLSLE
jgi:hypothetical protein